MCSDHGEERERGEAIEIMDDEIGALTDDLFDARGALATVVLILAAHGIEAPEVTGSTDPKILANAAKWWVALLPNQMPPRFLAPQDGSNDDPDEKIESREGDQ